jgi:hypothetical protein
MERGYPDGNNNVHDIAGSETQPPVSKTDRGFLFLRAVAGKAVHAVLSSIAAGAIAANGCLAILHS